MHVCASALKRCSVCTYVVCTKIMCVCGMWKSIGTTRKRRGTVSWFRREQSRGSACPPLKGVSDSSDEASSSSLPSSSDTDCHRKARRSQNIRMTTYAHQGGYDTRDVRQCKKGLQFHGLDDIGLPRPFYLKVLSYGTYHPFKPAAEMLLKRKA